MISRFQRHVDEHRPEVDYLVDLHEFFHCLWNDHGGCATMRNGTRICRSNLEPTKEDKRTTVWKKSVCGVGWYGWTVLVEEQPIAPHVRRHTHAKNAKTPSVETSAAVVLLLVTIHLPGATKIRQTSETKCKTRQCQHACASACVYV